MKTLAIIGRTNVGKSTLFNKLCHTKKALVHDRPGVTRDRKEGIAVLGNKTFRVIDTAGLEKESELARAMWHQTELAMEEADILLMVGDVREELSALDIQLAKQIRKIHKPVLLVANKCEGKTQRENASEFFRLGLGEPILLSAEHKIGFEELTTKLLPLLGKEEEQEEKGEKPLKLAIVGRPNVGKSTLINHLLGQERLLTGPMAGLTRDAISVKWHWMDHPILLTDTAGLRKFGKISDDLERLAGSDTKNAIDFAEIVILVLDAAQPLEKQDLAIASKVLEEGRCLVLAINKWDTVTDTKETMKLIRERLQESLQQVKGLPLIPISAKTGKGIKEMMKAVFEVYELWNKRVPTHKLNLFLTDIKTAHPTPLAKNGRRVPLKYMTQVNSRPPTFVIFTSNPDRLPDSYIRYISNELRAQFGLVGVPIRINLRKRENPYTETE